MLTCPVCSTPNPDAAAYCSRCGATLPRAAGTLPGSPVSAALGPVDPPAAPALKHRRLTIGDVVDNKYRIESVLGEGGMGIVYLARDQNTDTHVVVKAIRGELAHEPDLRERVRAEGRALAHIDHPNVVRLNAIVIEHNDLFLVMQFVDGQSLDRIIERHVREQKPLPFAQALAIFRQIVAGVGAAHREGVVHRDIKPGNVMIRARDGVAKVTDFGIAKEEADAKAGKGKTQGIIGSLWYMAPEQVMGRRDLDKRLDIYALGVVFFEMLTGRVPFDAPSDYDVMKMHVEAPLPLVAPTRSDVPPAVDAILARACAKDREQRYPSCDDLLAALDQLTPDTRPATVSVPVAPPPSVPAPPVAPPEPSRRATTIDDSPSSRTAPREPAPRPRWPLALGAVAALAIGGSVWLFGFSGLLDEPAPRPRPAASVRPSATASATAAPPASSAPVAPVNRLAALQGRWLSESGRRYQAVLLADFLEFRVIDPKQFPGQDYQVDESRFNLANVAGQPWFSVEDKIRPIGPSDSTFAPTSRGTCQIVWKALNNEPLKAYFDGSRLRVDMVNINPTVSNFDQTAGKVVTGCKRLDTAKPERIETTLTREP